MKLKKTLLTTLTLVAILGICLTGCKNNKESKDNTNDEPGTTPAYNENIQSKVKGTGVGYWMVGDSNNYTIFTLERQNEYLISENYLNGIMFFASSDYDKVFYTTVTYDDETIWAFSDLSITFNANDTQMILNIGDKQYTLNKVTIDDVSIIRDRLIKEKEESEREEVEDITNVETMDNETEVITKELDAMIDKNANMEEDAMSDENKLLEQDKIIDDVNE